MTSWKEISSSLYGVYQLAKRDQNALGHFNISAAGFFSSFAAMLFAIPFFSIENSIDYAALPIEISLIPFLVIINVALLINWAVYLLTIGVLAKYLDYAPNFSVFAIVYNWSQLAIMILWFPISIILTGLLGAENTGLFQLLFMLATYVYLWYVLRVTLAVSGSLALGLTFLEFLLTLIAQFTFADFLYAGAT